VSKEFVDYYITLYEVLYMQALRKIMVANELSPIMDIPSNMRKTQVEVIVLPISNITAKPKTNISLIKKLKGSLSKYANPNLRTLEKKAFEMAIEENHKKGKYNVKDNS
jgi:hypothetical protein